jgi:PAS domain S-box-containing protein
MVASRCADSEFFTALPLPEKVPIVTPWADEVLQALPTAVYTTDAAGRITFYNEAAAAFWGVRPELGKSEWCGSWRLNWPDGRPMPHSECPMAIALKEKRAISGAEAVAVRPDGTLIHFLAYPTPIWDESGALVGAVNTLVDISERKTTEETAQRLAVIVESSDDAILSQNLNGIVTSWNRAAERLYGHAAEEIIGEPVTMLIPADRHGEEREITERVRRGEHIEHYETVRRCKDGSLVNVSLTVSPIKDSEGRVAGASKIARDITDLKKAGEAQRRLAAIVESSDDAIVSMSVKGIIKTWNSGAERLLGYSAEEVIGKPITILIPRERQGEETDILARVSRGERIKGYETVRQRKDGSLVEISLAVSPIKNGRGRVIGVSKIARDITERRRAEEQHRLLMREMNHRIGNLFALAGAVTTLSTRFAATPRDLADAVQARLTALARAHSLTLAHSSGGERCDQLTTLQNLIETITAPYLEQDRAAVTINGPGVPVCGKPAMSMALLLHEIATNAAKYGALSSPTGQVDISWSVQSEELLLTWRERGGPPVNGRPEHEGFGSFLARLTATGQLGGKVSYDWNREGLTFYLSAPLARLLA